MSPETLSLRERTFKSPSAVWLKHQRKRTGSMKLSETGCHWLPRTAAVFISFISARKGQTNEITEKQRDTR